MVLDTYYYFRPWSLVELRGHLRGRRVILIAPHQLRTILSHLNTRRVEIINRWDRRIVERGRGRPKPWRSLARKLKDADLLCALYLGWELSREPLGRMLRMKSGLKITRGDVADLKYGLDESIEEESLRDFLRELIRDLTSADLEIRNVTVSSREVSQVKARLIEELCAAQNCRKSKPDSEDLILLLTINKLRERVRVYAIERDRGECFACALRHLLKTDQAWRDKIRIGQL